MRIVKLDHVQLAMPQGEEELAIAFYEGLLGIPRIPKPSNLEVRGGCWFERGDLKLHLGVDPDFRAARKAHPALLVDDLDALSTLLEENGYSPTSDAPLEGYRRLYVDDPFGNRLELLEES